MIRVLLAEDQAMVRGALTALLKLEPDLDVIGSAANGEEAWTLIERDKPDVLVTDIEMPRLSGLELAQRIRERGVDCKVIILTTFARSGFLRRALDAGVGGYLLKDAPADQLAEALRKVHAELPFDVVPDPRRQLYAALGVTTSPLALLHPRGLRAALRAAFSRASVAPSAGVADGPFGLPADFLVAPSGRTVAVKYGVHADDQWSIDDLVAIVQGSAQSEARA